MLLTVATLCVLLRGLRLFNCVAPSTQDHYRFYHILYILWITNLSSIWNIVTYGQDMQKACEYWHTQTRIARHFFHGPTAPTVPGSPECRGFTITLRHTTFVRTWMSDQPVAETSTWQYTTLKRDRLPCPRQDSNPHFQERAAVNPCLRSRGQWDWQKSFFTLVIYRVRRHGTRNKWKSVCQCTFCSTQMQNGQWENQS